jgi:hypothetical protein
MYQYHFSSCIYLVRFGGFTGRSFLATDLHNKWASEI